MKTNQKSFQTVIMGVLTIVAAMMGAARAADKDWDGGGADRNWTTDANWGGTAPAAGDNVDFSATGAGIVEVDANVTVGALRIMADGYTLQGNQIAIDPSGRWGTLYDIYISGKLAQIDNNLELQGDMGLYTSNFTNANDRPIINGVISDDGTPRSITFEADSRYKILSLRGANTYAGGTTVSNMTLELGDNSALGTGTWTLEDGGAPTYVYVTKDIALNNAVSLKGDMLFGRYSPLDGTLTLNGPISIDAAGVNIEEFDYLLGERLELAGTITDNGNGVTLTTSQRGEILLGSDNTITGTVTWVSSGEATLAIGNDNALGTGTLQVTEGVNGNGGAIHAEGIDVDIDNDIVLDGNLPLTVGESTGNSVTLTGEFSSTAGSSFNKLTISSGSTLAATGTITAGARADGNEVEISSNATLAPGNTGNYGTLTIDGDLDFSRNDPRSIFQIDLKDAVAGTGYDQLILNGEVYLEKAQLELNLDAEPVLNNSDLAFILVNDGTDPIAGFYDSIFNGLSDGATVNLGTVLGSPATAQISYFGDSVSGTSTGGNDVVLYNFEGAVIPEPSSVVLMLLGVAATVVFRRRGLTKA